MADVVHPGRRPVGLLEGRAEAPPRERELVVDAATGRMRPARRLGTEPAPPETAYETVTNAPLLLLFIITLLIPVTFNLGGLSLSPHRLLLMAVIVPLSLRFVQDRENPVNVIDIFIIAYIVWSGLAVFVNHGTSRLVYIASTIIDQFGAYLIGRQLIRHATDYRLLFTYILWSLLFLFPFAVFQLVAGGGDMRMGLFRVRTVFPHPILFGLFCGIAAANFFYIFRDSPLKKWAGTLLASVMTLMSLSTGPLLSLMIQISAIAWDHVSRAIPGRWVLLGILTLLAVAVIELTIPGGLLGLIIEEVAFNAKSGRGRLEIFEYGAAEVARHPWFGIGFDEWVRPYWRKSSVDNFYLVAAMRFGLPTFIFLITAVGVHMILIAQSMYAPSAFHHYRVGYLISLSALVIVLSAVHMWGALSVFCLTLLGAGQWFYRSGQVGPAGNQLGRISRETDSVALPDRQHPPSPRQVRTRARRGRLADSDFASRTPVKSLP